MDIYNGRYFLNSILFIIIEVKLFNLILYFILKKKLYVVLLSLFVYILKDYKYYKI